MSAKEINAKIEKGLPLSKQEEKFYFINMLGYTEEQYGNITVITENEDPNKLID